MWLLGVTALAGTAMVPTAAWAQSEQNTGTPADGADAAALPGEILVTARKTNERLLDVPVNVTAVTSESVEKFGVKDLFDLMNTVPSLSYGDTGNRNGNKLTMRGLGVSTTGTSKASVFLDGVYIAGNFTGLSLAGLERVEVLKGPQSTIFGRSTFAGAVNYVTRSGSNETMGSMSAELASYGEKRMDGWLSGPIVDDKLYGFLSGYFYEYDAPDAWKNSDGIRMGAQSSNGLLGKLTYTPTDNLTIRGLVSYHSIDDSEGSALFIDPADRNGAIAKVNPITGLATGTYAYYPMGSVPTFRPGAGDYDVAHNYLNNVGTRIDAWRTYLQLEWQSDSGYNVTLTGAQNDEKTDSQGNIYLRNRQPTGLGYVYVSKSASTVKDESLELRVATPTDKPIRLAAGAYYLHLANRTLAGPDSVTYVIAPGSSANDRVIPGGGSRTTTEDYSIFGAAYVDPLPDVTISLEGRYQWEKVLQRSRSTTQQLDIAAYQAGTASATFVELLAPDGKPYHGTFKKFLPRVNVQYDIAPNMNVYATYSIGTNPGRFNTSAYATVDQRQVQEEELVNYEIGFKGRILPNLTIEAAAYHMDWKNQQTQGSYYSGVNIYSITTNDGNSKVDGAELLVNWFPVKALALRGSVSYNDGKYKDFCSANAAALYYSVTTPPYACISVKGNALESVSKWQTSLSFDYDTPITDHLDGFVRGDWAYMSGMWDSELNLARIGAANVVNLRAGIQADAWTFELYAKNLTNEDTPTRLTRASDPAAGLTNQVNQNIAFSPRRPRQFGGRVTFKF
ncbi:TonB-dependent receptor [Novosphingobium sp. BL-52-GroH]|uniref:TonB-dependent receptor n=1 Tax=Novosphingobium sp. BL-52-GroH TaxID=3349877 RepID=UPI00384EA1B2